jgi:low affinity Fe/Cu permease
MRREIMGSHWSFLGAVALCALWATLGPLFGYSDSWQLVINTGTRDGLAIQLKLDELIRAVGSARNRLVNLEECTDEELEALHEEFQRLQRGERTWKKEPDSGSGAKAD